MFQMATPTPAQISFAGERLRFPFDNGRQRPVEAAVLA
jgi:hypothetical protein